MDRREVCRKDCPDCNGRGSVEQQRTRPCGQCSGKGWRLGDSAGLVLCPKCEGDGTEAHIVRQACRKCNGVGFFAAIIERYTEREQCPQCEGQGVIAFELSSSRNAASADTSMTMKRMDYCPICCGTGGLSVYRMRVLRSDPGAAASWLKSIEERRSDERRPFVMNATDYYSVRRSEIADTMGEYYDSKREVRDGGSFWYPIRSPTFRSLSDSKSPTPLPHTVMNEVRCSQGRRIEARLIHINHPDSFIGLFDRCCPVCDCRTVKQDLTLLFEEGTNGTKELCHKCLESFEQDTSTNIKSIVLETDLFQQLWVWTVENLSEYHRRRMRRSRWVSCEIVSVTAESESPTWKDAVLSVLHDADEATWKAVRTALYGTAVNGRGHSGWGL